MLLLAAAVPFLTAAGPSQSLIGIDGKTFFKTAIRINPPQPHTRTARLN